MSHPSLPSRPFPARPAAKETIFLYAPPCSQEPDSRFVLLMRKGEIMDLSNPPAIRHDGWTAARVAQFLEALAQDGNVRAACARVGMNRASAYRLKRRDGLFARAWAAAQVQAREVVGERARHAGDRRDRGGGVVPRRGGRHADALRHPAAARAHGAARQAGRGPARGRGRRAVRRTARLPRRRAGPRGADRGPGRAAGRSRDLRAGHGRRCRGRGVRRRMPRSPPPRPRRGRGAV